MVWHTYNWRPISWSGEDRTAKIYWTSNGQDYSKYDENYKIIDLSNSMNLNMGQDKDIEQKTKNCHNQVTENQQQRNNLLIRHRNKGQITKIRVTTDFSSLTLKARR